MTHPSDTAPLWWARTDLCYRDDGQLTMAGKPLAALAAAAGEPTFLYSAERIRAKLQQLHEALGDTGLPFRIFYAMKANRFAPLLTYLRTSGLCGIDACSPQELRFACGCGFAEADVSYTATSVSDDDLDILARHPDVQINCDSLSSIRRLGTRGPGRAIGLRVNPGMGVSYGNNQLLQYSGLKTTKFGIYREHFAEALALAAHHNLRVERIHFHVGIGYLVPQLQLWDEIVAACTWFTDQLPQLRSVNLGGGLGLPHIATDQPLDLHRWSAIIRKHFGPRELEICIEPGDFVVKDAGVLVLQVNTVERKQQVTFVGVNGGFNLAVEPFFYSLPCEPLPCQIEESVERAFAVAQMQPVTIAGNINEALDIWAEEKLLPPLREGDYLAFINAGGYAASMSSNHCMRGSFSERLLFPSI